MRKRTLGKTDLELTTVGLGTWAMGGGGWDFGWGPQDDEESIATIHRALELGIDWIDTAPVYGFGHAEEVVGRAIRGRRHEVTIATKCGLVWEPGNPTPINRLGAESVRAECEASLARLGIETIDLYQIHWPDPEERIEEAWRAIDALIDAGKVRYGGVSNFDAGQLARVGAIRPVASLQPPYSMMARGIESEILPHCARNGIGVVAYSPLRVGMLTGKVDRAWVDALPQDDWRRNSRDFRDPRLPVNLNTVEKLQGIARRAGRSVSELAIAWVLRRPEVTSAIVGARRPDQIEQTAPAADWELSEETIAEIDRLLAERERAIAALDEE
ncbi:MAG: aldo/keto reductase [Candidatus Eisenbacteria bacterium]|nr:aldo/keto reductase [Candidatus Latescibacterota bacterium]MBD3302943.1 aldo/keto reductase [Candidatus Eisenbacteria bacterium]